MSAGVGVHGLSWVVSVVKARRACSVRVLVCSCARVWLQGQASLSCWLLLLTLLASAAAAPQFCAGEYSTCPVSGVCALVSTQCKQCTTAGEYACPLSSACVASADLVATCPNTSGTHFDTSLPVEARLDYIFQQQVNDKTHTTHVGTQRWLQRGCRVQRAWSV